MQHPVHHRGRRLDPVGLDELLHQLLPDAGVGFAGGGRFQVRADPGLQRVEGLEISHLAGQRVVEGGELLALHLVQRQAHRAGLAAALRVGMVIGKADLGVHRLAGEDRHDLLLERGQRLAVAHYEGVRLGFLDFAVLDRGDIHPHHLPRRGLLPFHRQPGGALLAQPAELLGHRLIGDRRHRAGQAEAAQAAQCQLGTHLHHQLELDRLALLEFQVPDRGIGDRLQGFGGLGLLPPFPDDLFQDPLADLVAEAAPDHGVGGLALAESGQARPLGVLPNGLGGGLLDPLHRYGDAERLGGGVFGRLGDGDGAHMARKSNPAGAGGHSLVRWPDSAGGPARARCPGEPPPAIGQGSSRRRTSPPGRGRRSWPARSGAERRGRRR